MATRSVRSIVRPMTSIATPVPRAVAAPSLAAVRPVTAVGPVRRLGGAASHGHDDHHGSHGITPSYTTQQPSSSTTDH